MSRELVTLTQVETRVEAEVIISMLKAYGIYAHSPALKARLDPYSINVVDSDLEDARALLTATEA
jgi:hypothetical protein